MSLSKLKELNVVYSKMSYSQLPIGLTAVRNYYVHPEYEILIDDVEYDLISETQEGVIHYYKRGSEEPAITVQVGTKLSGLVVNRLIRELLYSSSTEVDVNLNN